MEFVRTPYENVAPNGQLVHLLPKPKVLQVCARENRKGDNDNAEVVGSKKRCHVRKFGYIGTE